MKIGIHQPNYIPWTGYFYKIFKSDIFIFLDDVQYEKNGFSDRNSIKTPQGSSYLKIPVELKGTKKNYNDIRIKNDLSWKEKHLKTISMNYKRSQYYLQIYKDLESIYYNDYETLSEFNMFLIKAICHKMTIQTDFKCASSFNVKSTSTQRLISIIKLCDSSIYLSGQGARNYQDISLFNNNNIKIEYLDFSTPKYMQLWGEFIPNLSIIDMLFNCGYEGTFNIIKNFK